MNRIRLHVAGPPGTITAQQKGISFKHRVVYTKSAVKAEARRIRRNLLQLLDDGTWGPVGGDFRTLTGPLSVKICVVYPLTAEQARKFADRLSERFVLLHTKRPDVDNTVKLLLDVLTGLKLWEDDSQICDLELHKRYGSFPGIYIAVSEGVQ